LQQAQCDDQPLRAGGTWLCQQPVAARNLCFLYVTDDIQRDALARLRARHWLVLRMQRPHAQRQVQAAEPQRVAHPDFTAQRGAGDYQPGAFQRESAVDGEPETAARLKRRCVQAVEVLAQRFNALLRMAAGNKLRCRWPAELLRELRDLLLHLRDACGIDAVGFGQRHAQRRLSGEAQQL
jgi:hypothetical protein